MTFQMAPIAGAIRWITHLFIALPFVFLAYAYMRSDANSIILYFLSAIFLATNVVIYFSMRPRKIEVSDQNLIVDWGYRRNIYKLSDITRAEKTSFNRIHDEFGLGLRIGAGGPWGGFGVYKTSKETFSLNVSRTDWLVLIKFKDQRSLLLTPEKPEKFLELIKASAHAH